MKKSVLALLVFFSLMTGLHLHGQIALKAEISQRKYLQYEPVYVRLTMRNLSGHPLVFGENQGLRGTLRFEITGLGFSGYARLLTRETPTMKGIILQPGTTRVFTYNVSTYYDIRKQDHYNLKAIISHPQLRSAYESNQIGFSITNGREVWKALVGIPESMMKNKGKGVPTRKYRIMNYNTGLHSLYVLQIEDDKRIYSLRRLGLELGDTMKPQCAVDDMSRLHVLVAASPKVFAYYLFDVNGSLEKKEVRLKTDTRPRLVCNRDVGTVLLSGGRRARPDQDYEEIRTLPYIKQAMEEQHTSDVTQGAKKSLLDND